jgi:hypothetical protein
MNVRGRWIERASGLGARCLTALLSVACNAEQCRRDPTPQSVAGPQTVRDPVQVPATPTTCPAAIVAARRGGRDADRYAVPTPEEASALSRAVAQLLENGATARAAAAASANAAGYELVDVAELPGTVLLRELETRMRGGGAYLLRLQTSSRTVVQAPHTFFDEGTLPLACELFQRSSALGLFVDTAHRYLAADVDEQGEHPADVAHAAASLFQAATAGLLQVARAATVVQLHGFATRASGRSVVLSAGVPQANEALTTQAAKLLTRVLGAGVARFPDDTRELGALKNVQGIATRAAGGRFLHVELDARLRKLLLADAALRARFLEALAESVRAP